MLNHQAPGVHNLLVDATAAKEITRKVRDISVVGTCHSFSSDSSRVSSSFEKLLKAFEANPVVVKARQWDVLCNSFQLGLREYTRDYRVLLTFIKMRKLMDLQRAALVKHDASNFVSNLCFVLNDKYSCRPFI